MANIKPIRKTDKEVLSSERVSEQKQPEEIFAKVEHLNDLINPSSAELLEYQSRRRLFSQFCCGTFTVNAFISRMLPNYIQLAVKI